jgi:hypothetical protein
VTQRDELRRATTMSAEPPTSPTPRAEATRPARASRRTPPSAAGTATRRARLVLKRVEPWSVLKLSLVLSLALFVVGLVAVAVLYSVLEGMGVPTAVNQTVAEVTAGAGGEEGFGDVLTLRGVLTVTAVVGAVNAVLLTALATLSALLYNLCAEVVGGVDVTLSERD